MGDLAEQVERAARRGAIDDQRNAVRLRDGARLVDREDALVGREVLTYRHGAGSDGGLELGRGAAVVVARVDYPAAGDLQGALRRLVRRLDDELVAHALRVGQPPHQLQVVARHERRGAEDEAGDAAGGDVGRLDFEGIGDESARAVEQMPHVAEPGVRLLHGGAHRGRRREAAG